MFEGASALSNENKCLIHQSFSSQNENWFVPAHNGYTFACWGEFCTSDFTPITQDNIFEAVDLWFSDQGSAESTYGHIGDWNTSCVYSMYSLFKDKGEFTGDISQWDVSSVTNMQYLFRNTNFNGDISGWDVSSVTNMGYAFDNNETFSGDLSAWDVSSVTDMGNMFWGAESFNSDLSSWDVSSVTNMTNLFMYNYDFNSDLSSWDVSNVTSMTNIFRESGFNSDISSWDVSNVINMQNMFYGATSFNQDISSWDVSNVNNFSDMFEGASALSDENKCAIGESFSISDVWPYDWSALCVIAGCTDENACNYDSSAGEDNGSCEYEDCTGECGGDATVDECGVCDGPGAIYECGCEDLSSSGGIISISLDPDAQIWYQQGNDDVRVYSYNLYLTGEYYSETFDLFDLNAYFQGECEDCNIPTLVSGYRFNKIDFIFSDGSIRTYERDPNNPINTDDYINGDLYFDIFGDGEAVLMSPYEQMWLLSNVGNYNEEGEHSVGFNLADNDFHFNSTIRWAADIEVAETEGGNPFYTLGDWYSDAPSIQYIWNSYSDKVCQDNGGSNNDCYGVVNKSGPATMLYQGEDISEACDCEGNIEDCAGECGGDAEYDECGVCGGPGIADGACDCDGNVDLGCGCGESGPEFNLDCSGNEIDCAQLLNENCNENNDFCYSNGESCFNSCDVECHDILMEEDCASSPDWTCTNCEWEDGECIDSFQDECNTDAPGCMHDCECVTLELIDDYLSDSDFDSACNQIFLLDADECTNDCIDDESYEEAISGCTECLSNEDVDCCTVFFCDEEDEEDNEENILHISTSTFYEPGNPYGSDSGVYDFTFTLGNNVEYTEEEDDGLMYSWWSREVVGLVIHSQETGRTWEYDNESVGGAIDGRCRFDNGNDDDGWCLNTDTVNTLIINVYGGNWDDDNSFGFGFAVIFDLDIPLISSELNFEPGDYSEYNPSIFWDSQNDFGMNIVDGACIAGEYEFGVNVCGWEDLENGVCEWGEDCFWEDFQGITSFSAEGGVTTENDCDILQEVPGITNQEDCEQYASDNGSLYVGCWEDAENWCVEPGCYFNPTNSEGEGGAYEFQAYNGGCDSDDEDEGPPECLSDCSGIDEVMAACSEDSDESCVEAYCNIFINGNYNEDGESCWDDCDPEEHHNPEENGDFEYCECLAQGGTDEECHPQSHNELTIQNVDIDSGSLELHVVSDQDIAGFEIYMSGLNITSISGGYAEEFEFMTAVTGEENTILGFSLTGAVIPSGDGLLTIVHFDPESVTEEICFTSITFADYEGNAYDMNMGGCYQTCQEDECGVCNGDGYSFCDDDGDGVFNIEQWGYGVHSAIVEDVPEDQGGRVYIHFNRSFYDTDTLSRSEVYTVERMDGDNWVVVQSFGAYGAENYTVEASTLYNDVLTEFRIIAHMDEGNFESFESITGYSVDNINPSTPDNVYASASGNNIDVLWEYTEDIDFAYHEFSQLWDTPIYTTENQISTAIDNDYDEYHIRSVDVNGNQSEKSDYIGAHNLGVGANLIGVCVVPNDNSIDNVLGNGISGAIGESIAASLQDGNWVGSLAEINPQDGYWVRAEEDMVHLTFGNKQDDFIEHELNNNLELISFCCPGTLALNDYLDILYNQGITSFIGQGEAAQRLPNGIWVGSLSALHPGYGYWIGSNGNTDLMFDCEETSSNPLARVMDDKLNNDYSQSTQQAFYFIETIDEIINGDIINAYCNDNLVGSRVWSGPYTDIPTMGDDGHKDTQGYCDLESTPVFKVERGGEEIFELEGDVSAWKNNELFMVSYLDIKEALPEDYLLSNAYPNPFNPSTRIDFAIPVDGNVSIMVYDLQGREIVSLVDRNYDAGHHHVLWNANEFGSGTYFVKIIAGEYIATQKVMLIK